MGSAPSKKNFTQPKSSSDSSDNNKPEDLDSITDIAVDSGPDEYEAEKIPIIERLKLVQPFDRKAWLEYASQSKTVFGDFRILWEQNVKAQRNVFNDIKIVSDIPKLFNTVLEMFFLDDDNFSFPIVKDLTGFMHNASHFSSKFSKMIFNEGCVDLIMNRIISNWRLAIETLFESDFNEKCGISINDRFQVLFGYYGILHNVIRHNSETRIPLRSLGLLEKVNTCIESLNKIKSIAPAEFLKLSCYFILAYLITEGEQDLVETSRLTLTYIVTILSSALKYENHHSSDFGFDSEETLLAINQLAKSDKNKEILAGHLKLIFQAMNEALNETEQQHALNCLWTLSFNEKCRDYIKRPTNIRNLENVSKQGKSIACQRLANNVLFEVRKADKIIEEINTQAGEIKGHVMLSYSWKFKSIVFKIRDFLRSKQYNVWIDVDSMKGSTIDCMAEAVENSSIVIVCFSHKYKESTPCRSEAEYAYHLKKEIIPVKVEKDYKADGWLGFIVNTRLWIDFTKSEVSVAYEKLLNQLGSKGKRNNNAVPRKAVIQEIKAEPSYQSNTNSETKSVKDWTEKDVQNFIINECGLKKYGYHFKNCSGPELLELKRLSELSPGSFYSSIKTDLGLPLIDARQSTKSDWPEQIKNFATDGLFVALLTEWKTRQLPLEDIFSNTDLIRDLPTLFIDLHERFLIKETDFICSAIEDICIFFLSATHYSSVFCKRIFQDGCIEYMIEKVLSHSLLSIDNLLNPQKVKNNNLLNFKSALIFRYIGILHNILRLNEDLRIPVKNLGTLDLMIDMIHQSVYYTESEASRFLKVFCYITLAYLLDETEVNLMQTCLQTLNFIRDMLKRGLEKADHQSEYGFYVDETLHAINQLAKNDDNKKLMKGYIPLLFRVIEHSNDVEERCALDCLYTLSFDDECKTVIKKEGYIRILQKLSEYHTNTDRKDIVKAILWEIDEKYRKELTLSNKQSKKFDFMLSYQWQYQKVVMKISNSLKSLGYKVWLDIEQMNGSTNEAMAYGIESSTMFIMCFSRSYKNSNNCRREAVYASALNKVIIPLRMEKYYQGTGWLGIIIGDKLWVDFSDLEKYQSSFKGLTHQIDILKHKDHSNIPITTNPSPIESNNPLEWPKDKVHDFIKNDCGLKEYSYHFEDLTGAELLTYKTLCQENLNNFLLSLKDDLKIPFKNAMKFSTSLRQLKTD
ncbi:DgyrCDS7910 [Dimorphilus gyrociliatus]|uniref:DgyrCDS7910 n=1 Tax=Dimorphilus gyrociliatus TaxID=2664684 RepID=A0A7I8VSJ3_9ANNE|nr:DgyrCDS7910 [Dimorphilus gyrociliatus]